MYRLNFSNAVELKKDSTLEEKRNYIRKRREQECFPIINRGKLWYNKLSIEQHNELTIWYNNWLDATETLIVPHELSWINNKLNDEEIL